MTKSFHPYPSEAFKSLWAVPPWPWQTFILIPDLLLEGSLIHSTVLVLFICQPLLGNGKFHLNLARQDLLRTLPSSCRHWHLETLLDLPKIEQKTCTWSSFVGDGTHEIRDKSCKSRLHMYDWREKLVLPQPEEHLRDSLSSRQLKNPPWNHPKTHLRAALMFKQNQEQL